MAEKELLLGIDLGTSGCKVTLIDTDCNFVGDGYTEYTTYHPNIGWSEQDPADWFPQHAPGRAWHLIANTENLAAVVLGHEGRFFGGSGVGPHDGLA